MRLGDNKGKSIYKSLDKILQIYNNGGYHVRHFARDNEFTKIMDDVKDQFVVTMECTNVQDHEQHAEQNNRTIENQDKQLYTVLPTRQFPKS